MTLSLAPLDVQYIVETLVEDLDSDASHNRKRSTEILRSIIYEWRHSVKKNRIPSWVLKLEEELNATA